MRRQLTFADLFAGLGGFHLAMKTLGLRCVFASEIDEDLRRIYERNFGQEPVGDLRQIPASVIPPHDVLCAGFPCQPFSKAGEQRGTKCRLWGDLFSGHVLRVIESHRPTFLLMENVANLQRHNGGRTWAKMRRQLEALGYEVDARILSPHDFGVPQIRHRLFIVGSLTGLAHFKWPVPKHEHVTIRSILDREPADARSLTPQVTECLEVWQEFLRRAPKNKQLPSFPIWTMEFQADYPYEGVDSLYDVPLKKLRKCRGSFGQRLDFWYRDDILQHVPSHAKASVSCFPRWKQLFIRQNRDFYKENRSWIDPWLPRIRQFPSSLQKFEWNCKGEKRDIWSFIIQFRASGVRVKRPTTAPSLVAMTSTQIPIIGWERRYMTPRECSRLQSMRKLKHLPEAMTKVYRALGNAVNVKVVEHVGRALTLEKEKIPREKIASLVKSRQAESEDRTRTRPACAYTYQILTKGGHHACDDSRDSGEGSHLADALPDRLDQGRNARVRAGDAPA